MRADSTAWFAAACLAAAVVPFFSAQPTRAAGAGFPGWPTHHEGKLMRELPLTALEQRFAEGFPGRLGRFTDGKREIVIRWVAHDSRKLHPAIDCFRGSGYSVTPRPLQVDAEGAHWGSFVATRGANVVTVRERIYDAAGNNWTDVSSWYWAAARGATRGPWWAITVAENRGEI
jgi:hypothetical protein